MILDTDPLLARIIRRLTEVSGIAGIVLGGSRAKGTAIEADRPLDTRQLLAVVRELVGDPASAAVAPIGAWGPRIAGCAYRALCCVGQVLFALNRRYLANEKGALADAAGLPSTIPNLSDSVSRVWTAIGNSEFAAAISELMALDDTLQGLAAAAR